MLKFVTEVKLSAQDHYYSLITNFVSPAKLCISLREECKSMHSPGMDIIVYESIISMAQPTTTTRNYWVLEITDLYSQVPSHWISLVPPGGFFSGHVYYFQALPVTNLAGAR